MVSLQWLIASALAISGEPQVEVLDFTSQRCGPCQQMSPIVSRLNRQKYSIRKIDMDQEREEAKKFGIEKMPTFLLVVDGREVERIVGLTSEQKLRSLCERGSQIAAERATAHRPPVIVAANEAHLGAEAPLPGAKPSPDPKDSVPDAPGILNRLLPRKKSKPSGAPVAARGQDEAGAPADAADTPATPLSATVRLRVKDASGENFGTGTIIDSRPGQTLILTCGHIFRHWGQGSQVQVDLFRGKQNKTVVGRKVSCNLKDDVGLVSISTETPLPACPVAPPATKIIRGAPVVSVGCSRGDHPTVQRQNITALNRYMGADNIECSVVPVQGRSGGGLFNREGQVIGVCMAADPGNNEGLYAGLKTIHNLLDRNQLAHVYRQPAEAADSRVAELPEEIANDGSMDAEPGEAEMARKSPRRSPERAADERQDPADAPARPPRVSREEVVGAEVVIIIHSRGKPGAPSKVVRLHRASRGFWENLVPELDEQPSIQETTMTQPARDAKAPPVSRKARRLPAEGATTDEVKPYRRKPRMTAD